MASALPGTYLPNWLAKYAKAAVSGAIFRRLARSRYQNPPSRTPPRCARDRDGEPAHRGPERFLPEPRFAQNLGEMPGHAANDEDRQDRLDPSQTFARDTCIVEIV